jgi:hypothetical protein
VSTQNLIDGTKPSGIEFAELPSNKDIHAALELAADVRKKAADASAAQAAEAAAKTRLLANRFASEAELEKAYVELEKKLGQQGQEIGSLRKLTQGLIDSKRTSDLSPGEQGAKHEPVTSDELLRDPQAAIERISKSQTAAIERQLAETRMELARAAFEKKYPTFRADMEDPEFLKFAAASPYRQRLAQRAAETGDLEAADELWTAYADVRQVPSKTGDDKGASQATSARKAGDPAQAALVSSGSAAAGAAKPIYSRIALQMKQIKDPTGYYDPAFQAMIIEAMREGRVQ